MDVFERKNINTLWLQTKTIIGKNSAIYREDPYGNELHKLYCSKWKISYVIPKNLQSALNELNIPFNTEAIYNQQIILKTCKEPQNIFHKLTYHGTIFNFINLYFAQTNEKCIIFALLCLVNYDIEICVEKVKIIAKIFNNLVNLIANGSFVQKNIEKIITLLKKYYLDDIANEINEIVIFRPDNKSFLPNMFNPNIFIFQNGYITEPFEIFKNTFYHFSFSDCIVENLEITDKIWLFMYSNLFSEENISENNIKIKHNEKIYYGLDSLLNYVYFMVTDIITHDNREISFCICEANPDNTFSVLDVKFTLKMFIFKLNLPPLNNLLLWETKNDKIKTLLQNINKEIIELS